MRALKSNRMSSLLFSATLRPLARASRRESAALPSEKTYVTFKQSHEPLPTKSVVPQPRLTPVPARKQYLARHHAHVMNTSPLILFFRQGDFQADEWRNLRLSLQNLSGVPLSSEASQLNKTEDSLVSTSPPSPAEPNVQLKLTVIRAGLLPFLLRKSHSLISVDVDRRFLESDEMMSGQMAIVTSDVIHPPTLEKALKLLKKVSLTAARCDPPVDPKKKENVVQRERLRLMSSLIGGKAFDPAETMTISRLPPLKILQANIIALLSMPGRKIVDTLGAKGREVLNTVKGYEEGLKLSEGDVRASSATTS